MVSVCIGITDGLIGDHKMIDMWSLHFWKGIKFGYPLCCIIWFCNSMTNYGEQRDSLYERMFAEQCDSLTRKQADFSDRNLCPDCTLQNLITLNTKRDAL